MGRHANTKEPGHTTRTVFLVDDEPLVLSALVRVMRQEGYEIRSFGGPEQALDAMREIPPDCVISDYYMPRMDGLDFLARLKQDHAGVARVLLTGGHIDSRIHAAMEEGVVQVLMRKPWHIESIRKVMEHVDAGDSGVWVSREKEQPATQDRPSADTPGVMPGEDGRVQRRAIVPVGAADTESTATDEQVVMVVDDDPVFLELMKSWLQRLAFRPVTASGAHPALDLAREVTPGVILVDLIMPGFDGFELMGALKDLFPHTPIVAITGARERDKAVEAFRRGASVFLHKPLELNTLEATIRRCLQLGSMFERETGNQGLAALLQLQHAIASGMATSRLLHLMLQEMIRATGADTASAMLVEPDGETMRIAASYGLDPEVVKHERVAVGERISGWVLAHDQPQMVLGDSSSDPRLDGVQRTAPASVGLCLPLRGRDRVVGVACVTRYENEDPFTRDAIDLGLLLGGEVARAIEREDAAEEQMNLERNLMRRDKLVTIGELASGVAHEINNPMGYVSSNVSSLAEYLDEVLPLLRSLASGRDKGTVERVLQQASAVDLDFILSDLPVCLRETMEGVDRVLTIVSDLKAFARDDGEAKELGDVNQILDSTVSILWNQIKYKAELVRDYGELPAIPCFPSRLGQVFLNLIYNAAQAVDRGGRIVLRTGTTQDSVFVEIEDNGQGMEPDVLDQIFEPFYTTKPRGVGTGLGLSIARKIVDQHDGRIEATSIGGKGSTFRLELPLPAGD